MSLNVQITDAATLQMKTISEKVREWISYGTGTVAIDFANEAKKWVYRDGYFQKHQGLLQDAIYARNAKKGKRVLSEWLVGPRKEFNWIAKWIPESSKYKGKNRDFMHDSWKSYQATKDVGNQIIKVVQENMDHVK